MSKHKNNPKFSMELRKRIGLKCSIPVAASVSAASCVHSYCEVGKLAKLKELRPLYVCQRDDELKPCELMCKKTCKFYEPWTDKDNDTEV